ncbi:MAG TPA: transposase domain-containing protein, partial [Nitrospiraceae bacterium]|nr:transposase domain-containing protein [Nitrospiraceae bacterium]
LQGMRVSRLHVVPLMRKMASPDRGGESGPRRYSIVGTCRLNDVDPHAFDINTVNRRLATIKP